MLAHVQAIRWRLIKSPVGAERHSILALFAQHDVLDCKSSGAESGLVNTLASTNDVVLMMELVRLMSVLASDSAGRAYLLQSQGSVISELHKILISAPSAMLHIKEGVPAILCPCAAAHTHTQRLHETDACLVVSSNRTCQLCCGTRGADCLL